MMGQMEQLVKEALEDDLKIDLANAFSELVQRLKGRGLSFFLDELQIFSSKLRVTHRKQLPAKVATFKGDSELAYVRDMGFIDFEKDMTDLYLIALYDVIGEFLAKARASCINIALAGTYGSLRNSLVTSPCSSHSELKKVLPLPMFNLNTLEELLNKFFNFPSVTGDELREILQQLIGIEYPNC